ncbi:MAG: UDP-2,4-diacetamido-2,4,6-trideoxy-beta-L-altropyranose hydrolase [Magnetococcales bacterium]|nr:UDP-2,4-diacetamido-2,4,6-trideoxy-beta-L-altropyranose hydrolase [Magnetococcales bacterium]
MNGKASKMIVLFRVDASLPIGSGHLMRCLTLAGRLRAEGAAPHFACREQPGDLIGLIAAQGYPVHRLVGTTGAEPLAVGEAGEVLSHAHWLPVTQAEDAQEVADLVRSLGPVAWLVVDHYGLDRRWEARLRPLVGGLMVIDDLADRPHLCDLLLDHNLHTDMQTRYRQWVPPYCMLLLGPHYALLREEFVAARRLLQQRDGAVRRLLLFLGGADPGNATAKVLEALDPLELPVDVVVGRSNPHRARIEAICGERPHFHYHEQVENMAQLMLQADLSIGAAGTTSWERCCMELPSLLLIMADNQRANAQILTTAGVALSLGEASVVSPAQIRAAVRRLMDEPSLCRQMQKNAASICDGLGANRVAMALQPLWAKDGKPLGLRPVCMADAAQIWAWQRHPNTRRWARNPQVPEYEAHCRWLHERLQEGDGVFNIIMHDQQPAGVLRLHRLPGYQGRRYEVSIFLDPERYRLGIAAAALRLGRRLLPDAELLAAILEGNTASLALFESLGYVQQERGIFVQFPPNPSS